MSLSFKVSLRAGDILTKSDDGGGHDRGGWRAGEKSDFIQARRVNRRLTATAIEFAAVLASACISPSVAIAAGFATVAENLIWFYRELK